MADIEKSEGGVHTAAVTDKLTSIVKAQEDEEPAGDAQAGIRKVEAALSAWIKYHLIAVHVM